jgi:hypothetical protein
MVVFAHPAQGPGFQPLPWEERKKPVWSAQLVPLAGRKKQGKSNLKYVSKKGGILFQREKGMN